MNLIFRRTETGVIQNPVRYLTVIPICVHHTPPPRGLSKNECTDFQHALSNISAYAPESPENRDFREVSQIYESVSQKQHFEKTVRCVSRKTASAPGVFAVNIVEKTKFRERNESDSHYENTFKNNVYNAHDFAKKTGVVCLRSDRYPNNERQSAGRIEAAAPAAVAGNRKHRRI